jgi:hypothetical protein
MSLSSILFSHASLNLTSPISAVLFLIGMAYLPGLSTEQNAIVLMCCYNYLIPLFLLLLFDYREGSSFLNISFPSLFS